MNSIFSKEMHMTTRLPIITISLAATLLLIGAGCGGNNDSVTSQNTVIENNNLEVVQFSGAGTEVGCASKQDWICSDSFGGSIYKENINGAITVTELAQDTVEAAYNAQIEDGQITHIYKDAAVVDEMDEYGGKAAVISNNMSTAYTLVKKVGDRIVRCNAHTQNDAFDAQRDTLELMCASMRPISPSATSSDR